MTDSRYPIALDDDITISRIDDNITELGGEVINSLRSAIFNIEEVLGLNPHGTSTDVVERLNTSLNPDGTIKASALSSIALVTLPIVNSMIAGNAGIEELKLDLDYSTAWLKAQHDSNYVLIINLLNSLTIDIGHLASHISHPSTYGRHISSDIDGYAGALYDGYNVQGMVYDLNDRIIKHLNMLIDAHNALAISFDSTGLPIEADNVQDAIAETSLLIEGATLKHQGSLHSNGILKSQNVSYNGTNHSYTVVASNLLENITSGSKSVKFLSLPTGFSNISRGDRIDIILGSDKHTRYVDRIDIPNFIVYFLVPIPFFGSGGSAVVYKKRDEYLAPSSLNVAIRKRDVSSYYGGSIIQLIHPSAPFALSNKIDTRNITSGDANIKLGWGVSPYTTTDINLYTIMTSFSAAQSAWSVDNLAIKLNEYFSTSGKYPFVAFTYNNELGIALDDPDGYLAIQTPSTNSAWSSIGFSEGDVSYSLERKFYIDGYDFVGIRKIIDTTGEVVASNLNQIRNINQDVIASGLEASGIIRVSNTGSDNGTYVFNQVNDVDKILISEHSFAVGDNIHIKSYADTFNVPSAPQNKTLYDLFLDGYNKAEAVFSGAERLEYYREQVVSTQDMSIFFDIVDISRDFPESAKRILYTISSGNYILQLGTRGSGTSIGVGGQNVILPAPTASIIGYKFKIYDADGFNYVELEVISDYSTLLTNNALEIDIYPRVSEDLYLQIGKIVHDKANFKYFEDRRLFGNIGRYEVRNDFTRDYISYPTSLLRGCGVIRDCSVSYSPLGTTLTFNGGTAITNGYVYNLSSRSFKIPADGANTYNLYVGPTGIVLMDKNDEHISGKITSPKTKEIIKSIDKVILYTITTNSSSQISSSKDLRRFVNNTDSKDDIIVESINNGELMTYGNFSSLKNAIDYVNTLGTDYFQRIIKITGTVPVSETLTLPNSTALEGDGAAILSFSGTGSIILGSNNTVRDLNFSKVGISSLGFLSGSMVSNLTLTDCNFQFDTMDSYNVGLNITDLSGIIHNCNFANAGKSIRADNISDTKITNCLFSYDSQDSGNIGIVCDYYLIRSIIKNCLFNNAGTSVWVKDLAVNNNIKDNICLEMYNNGFRLAKSSDNDISGNEIYTTVVSGGASVSAGTAFIRLGEGNDVNTNTSLRKNIFEYYGTQNLTSGVSMIDISSSGTLNDTILIEDNILKNIIADKGFSIGINCSPTSTYAVNLIIDKNILQNFSDASNSSGIKLSKCNNKIISNNIISNCYNSINIVDGTACNIIGNNIYGDKTTIWLEDVNGLSIVSNYFGSSGLSSLVFLLTSENGTINGNTFKFTASSSNSLLANYSDNITICGNNFIATTLTLLAPVVNSGTDNFYISNSFNITTPASTNMISISGGNNSVDLLNKGQTYKLHIPLIIGHSTDVEWQKTFSGGYTFGKTVLFITGYTTKICAVEFTNLYIPINSLFVKISIYYKSGNHLEPTHYKLYGVKILGMVAYHHHLLILLIVRLMGLTEL